jgi:arylsulfatase A-like enzyme
VTGRAPAVRRSIVAAAFALLVACRPASYDRRPAWPPFAIGVRFADVVPDPGSTDTLASRPLVTFGKEGRVALSASQRLELPKGFWGVDAEHPGQIFYRVPVPPELQHVARLVVEIESLDPTRPILFPPVVVRPDEGDTIASVPAPRAATRHGMPVEVHATGRVIPELAAREIETPPIAIPAGAVFSGAIGIEQAMWLVQTGTITFHVTAVESDGTERVLKEFRMDPFGWPLHRRWIEVRARLDAVAGRTVRLRLGATAVGDVSTLPLWADPVVLVPRTSPVPAYGVVLVSLDTLRARSVSAYGAERETTPQFDAFAGTGVLFEDASAAAPHTLTSHLSLFTGAYMHSTVVEPLSVLKTSVPTLPELLRRAGYDTAAFTEDGFIAPAFGFARGFAVYGEDKSTDFHRPEGHVETTFAHGVGWLQEHYDRPFFLFLHTYQVHFPYDPPPGYEDVFELHERYTRGPERDRLRYEQEARYTDDALAALLGEIDALGLTDRTLVIVLADHGEEFYEHGEHFHGNDLYDEAIHVPLVMRLPGLLPAARRAGPVSLVDVLPTILDLLGLPAPAGIDGESLLPVAFGAAPRQDRAAYSAPGTGFGTHSAVRTAGYTCIWHPEAGPLECFDRRRDPYERHPLDGQDLATGARAADALLAAFRAREPDVASADAAHPTPPDADPERLEKLRALGYAN